MTVSSTLVGIGGTEWIQNVGALNGTIRLTAYLKNIVVPSWIFMGVSDNTANSFQLYFDVAGLTVGNTVLFGNGTVTCSRIIAAGNGYSYLDMAGFVNTGANPAFVGFFPVDSNGGNTATLGQQFYSFGIGT